nr:hypothetical protein A4A49_41009 [Ipomoea batatas]GME20520.1 hypothetical protein A4A49_41009 [Ipomoea batatas]
MDYRRASSLLVIFLVFVALAGRVEVEAGRVLSQDFAAASNHLSSSVLEQAKISLSSWLEMLPSGPSAKGPGH